MKSVSVILTATIVLLAQFACADKMPAGALYTAVLPPNPHPQQVKTVLLVEEAVKRLSAEQAGFWSYMKCTKVNGDIFSVWIFADHPLFIADIDADTSYWRYIFQESGSEAIEYVDKRAGSALLPIWDFAGQLLPHSTKDDDGGFFAEGTYLGHPLIRKQILAPEPIELPENIKRLILDSELVIGTSRNFRDDGKGRKSRKDNYNYVPFTKDNYGEMIAAGINYFTADASQTEWIWDKPVFYDTRSKKPKFPEELYRSNFLGHSMFIDEPACRLAGKYPENSHTSVAVDMITDYINSRQNKDYYRFGLIKSGIDLGEMKIVEPVPIWETYVGTSYYQLAANPYGFVQECRWKINPAHDTEQLCMLQRINEEYGVDIPVTPRNLFLWFYSQITGSARIFDSKWGMSIYGQAEPQLRLPSMKLAYDMGASYIWFWTSDHDHHVPYIEQLALARQIRQYATDNPRPPLKQLTGKAKTVIVLPYGYTLPSIWGLYMWGTHLYDTNRTNEQGKTYKQVLTGAIKHIAHCLANDIPYDVVPAGPKFDPAVYDKVIRIQEDATVIITD